MSRREHSRARDMDSPPVLFRPDGPRRPFGAECEYRKVNIRRMSCAPNVQAGNPYFFQKKKGAGKSSSARRTLTLGTQRLLSGWWLSRCGSVRKMPPPGGAETCMGGHDAHSSHALLIADMICLSCCNTPPYNMCMCMTHVASACLRTPASQHTIVPVCHMILAARSGRARPISRPRYESDVCTLRWRPHIELCTDSGRTR